MKNQTELISVILPTYNAEKFLPHCIESLLSQEHSRLEIIAFDDFSKDKSYAILCDYAKKDSRVIASRNVKRYGISISLNRAVRNSSGKFIVFMNPEDIVHPQKFKQQLSYLLKHDNVVATGTQCIYVDEQQKKAGKSNFPDKFIDIYKKPINGATFLFDTLMINKYRIPKDLLYFKTNKNKFLYADVIIKLMKYGEISNLPQYLHYHRTVDGDNQMPSLLQLPYLLKLWFRSITIYDFNPSVKNFLYPSVKTRIS